MRDAALYEWLASTLQDAGEVRLAAVENQFDDEGAMEYAQTQLEIWARLGLVEERRAGRFHLIDATGLEQELQDEPESDSRESITQEDEPMRPGERSVVISVPSELHDDVGVITPPDGLSVVTLREALRDVVSSATDCLRLSVPYLELDGVAHIQTELDDLARDDIEIRVLTRGVLDPPSYGGNHADTVRTLRQMTERYHALSGGGHVDIRDYHHLVVSERGRSGEDQVLDRSVHMKAAVADETVAYIGSGEVRDKSMYMNAEAGYLVRENDEVRYWADFFDFIHGRGERVSRQHLQSLVR